MESIHMEYSTEMLNMIEEYAANLMTYSDIAILLDINVDVFRHEISISGSPARKAYWKGKTRTKYAIHKSEVDLAKLNSPMAVELVEKYLLEMALDENA